MRFLPNYQIYDEMEKFQYVQLLHLIINLIILNEILAELSDL